MKKSIKNLLFGLAASSAVIIPILATVPTSQQMVASATKSEITDLKVSYELGEYKEHSLYCADGRRNWEYLYWNDINRIWPGEQEGDGIFKPTWYDSKHDAFKFATNGKNNNDRFAYQQVKVNIVVPAHSKDFKVNLKTNFLQRAYCEGNANSAIPMPVAGLLNDTNYLVNTQVFNFEDNPNAHPERFNNLIHNENNVDSFSAYCGKTNLGTCTEQFCHLKLNFCKVDFFEHFPKNIDYYTHFFGCWYKVPEDTKCGPGIELIYSPTTSDGQSFSYKSDNIQWTLSNDTDSDVTVSRYIGVSWWLVGTDKDHNIPYEADVKIQLNASLDK